MLRIQRRDEQGSIVLTMLVMMILTALMLSTSGVVLRGLATSRRLGDSANALQLADAGVNEALQTVPRVATTTFSRSASLGAAGSYSYTATRDAGSQRAVWHIDVTGVDSTGVKRRVKADAVAGSQFNTPLFVNSTFTLHSGVSLDSFKSGTSLADMCTKKGIIGTNSPGSMTFGSSGTGGGVNNCQNSLLANGWSYAMDGCTSYGDGTQALPPTGPGKCPPPPQTYRTPRKFDPGMVLAPLSECGPSADPESCWDFGGPSASSMTCPSAAIPSLVGGKTYYFPASVTLLDGCMVTNPVMHVTGLIDLEKPVTIYTAGRVDIGNPNGQGGSINQPPNSTSVCGPSASPTNLMKDSANNPGYFYCPNWSGGLRIKVLSGANAGPINIRGNNTKFWGSMQVPSGAVTLNGSGITVWGAVVANTGSSNAQFTWHFDDELASVTTDQYILQNWREEALTG